MIPKVIHYVWLGKNEKTELFKQCLFSWRRFFPDAKIIEWNEDNLKFIDNKYYLEALDRGKYAFASDYARLRILSEYGGFYFDSDLELINNVSDFCGYDFVCCTEKGQNNIYYPIMTAFLGSAPNNRVIKSFLKCYDDLSFINKEGRENLTTNVILLSKVLKEQFGIADEICGNTKINLSNDEVIFPYYYFGRLLGGGG